MTDWTRHGECNGCGACCRAIAIMPLVRDAATVEDRPFYEARGFRELTLDGVPKLVLIARLVQPCPHVTEKDRCDMYERRPMTCRTFPRAPLDVVGLPCSYWFEKSGRFVGGMASPYPSDAATLVAAESAA